MVGPPRHYPLIHLTPPLGSHTRPLREDPETRDETRPASPPAPLPLVPRPPPNPAGNHRRGTPADRSGQSPPSAIPDAYGSGQPRSPDAAPQPGQSCRIVQRPFFWRQSDDSSVLPHLRQAYVFMRTTQAQRRSRRGGSIAWYAHELPRRSNGRQRGRSLQCMVSRQQPHNSPDEPTSMPDTHTTSHTVQ
jgi:hypothetical protein